MRVRRKGNRVRKTLDRFRQEAGTEYFDILLMHCMTDGNWPETRKFYMEGLAKAKEEGIVKPSVFLVITGMQWLKPLKIRGATLSWPA